MKHLDPRTRLALWVIATIIIISTDKALILIAEAAVITASLPFFGLFTRWLSSLRLMVPVAGLVFLIALISYGLFDAFLMVARLVALLTLSFIVFQKVTSDELGEGLRSLGLPYGISFILTAAMRYVPLLGERLSCIMDAQRSRGIDLRPRFSNLHNFLALVVPLLIQAILLSENLAMAMEARGFSRRSKGFKKEMRLYFADYAALVLATVILAVFVAADF